MVEVQRQDATKVRGRLTVLDQFFISCLWLAYNVQWGALIAIVVPHQIEAIVGPARKEFYNGLILPLGAVVSLLITPAAGAFSDRSRSRFGRRRPFLLTGALINFLFLLLLAGFGTGSSIGLFALAYMGVQLGSNWLGGPYAGLIPDVVPEEQRGSASGWMAVMQAAGTIIGALSAGALIRHGSYWPIYGLIAGAILLMVGLTWWGVRETPNARDPGPFRWRPFLRSFLLDPQKYRNFYWVLITRAMITMGVFSVYPFFEYFMGDVIRTAHPAEQTSFLLAIITLTSIPTSLIAGALSDRYGRKPLVYLSGGVMALASTIFVAVTLIPSLTFTFSVAVLFGLGYGAYLAVDWALGIDVLPAGEDAAKDMGIWHVSMVLPQMIAPAVTGFILTALKSSSLLLGYAVVFTLAAVWFLLGTVFIRQVRGVR